MTKEKLRTLGNELFSDLDLKYSDVIETIDDVEELSFSWRGGGAYLVQEGDETTFGVFDDEGGEQIFRLPSQYAAARLYLENLCN